MKTILTKIGTCCAGILVSLANISTSPTTVCLWHEPDCPKELLKE